MSIEFRKKRVKEKAIDIYTDVNTNAIDSLTYTEIDKINFYLTEVKKIIHKEEK